MTIPNPFGLVLKPLLWPFKYCAVALVKNDRFWRWFRNHLVGIAGWDQSGEALRKIDEARAALKFGGSVIMPRNLITTQCPFCLYLAPLPGFAGPCPNCGKNTAAVIGCIRYGDPESLSGEDAEAAYRLERVFAGMEEKGGVEKSQSEQAEKQSEAKA